MTEFQDATQRLIEFFSEPADTIPGPDDFLEVDLLQSYIQDHLQNVNKDNLDGVILDLMPGLKNSEDVIQAGRLSQFLGMMVESGGTPALALEPLLDRLGASIDDLLSHTALEDMEEEWVGEDAPDDLARTQAALHPMALASMAMLTRDIEAARTAQMRQGLYSKVEEAADYQGTLWYLKELLASALDLEAVVLNPEQMAGWVIRLNFVRNNFHMMSLLEHTLLEQKLVEGPEPDLDILELARGNTFKTGNVRPSALYHYYNWPYLNEDDEQRISGWTIWGEMSPHGIHRLDGMPLIIQTALPLQSRTWDPHFIFSIHPVLHPGIDILRTLEKEEMEQWLEKIKEAGEDR